MATDLLPADLEELDDDAVSRAPKAESGLRAKIEPYLRPLASLKLTVTLFAMSIFLIFVGTLAQARHDIWWVMANYFRTDFAWIEFQAFFPPAWFPNVQNVAGGFWFPGFYIIGGLMGLNLLAAHGLRFKVQSKGPRLWTGLGIIAIGCLVTWYLIAAGPNTDGSQASMPMEWIALWKLFLVGLACTCAGIAGAIFFIEPNRKAERTLLLGGGTLLLVLLGYLMFAIDAHDLSSEAMLSSMRILWQLIQAGFASIVLLVGCILVFRKRAGVVLLHAGVGLIMLNEINVHLKHKETMMTISEGDTANFAMDARTFELAVVDHNFSDSKNEVVVVPEGILRTSVKEKQPISKRELLPFDIQLVELFDNARLRRAKPGETQIADRGIGLKAVLTPERLATGTDNDKHNYPAAYVKLLDKQSGESLGTWLLTSLYRAGEQVEVGGKNYELALRFQRDYKPYTMKLEKVEAKMYDGTSIPQSYSSELELVDHTRGDAPRKVKVRMNEPWRYAGETFYQSGYSAEEVNPKTGQVIAPPTTTLQVVANFGWMIPYMGCMIVATGLLSHFSLVLVRFLRRRGSAEVVGVALAIPNGGVLGPMIGSLAAKKIRASAKLKADVAGKSAAAVTGPSSTTLERVLPFAFAGIAAMFLIYSAVRPFATPASFDFDAFGRLPIVYGGRLQPIDTYARNSLRMISLRERFVDSNDEYQPAVKWLLDVVARPQEGAKHRVFRIENPDVLSTLGLERRKYYRYSWQEVSDGQKEFDKARKALENKDESTYSVFEKKLAELNERVFVFNLLEKSFMFQTAGKFPTAAEIKADPAKAQSQAMEVVAEFSRLKEALDFHHAPLAVPIGKGDTWEPYTFAEFMKFLDQARKQPVDTATAAWERIFSAYADNDAKTFNAAVADYAALLKSTPPKMLAGANPTFEAWFNGWGPFLDCQWLYFAAFCLAAFAWLGWSGPFNRAAFGLIAATFVAHTLALGFRMYISGRPPVTNLYSSAIFIGWGAVLAGLILEKIYRLGFGNILAAVAGFATLMIADRLSLTYDGKTRGDTVGVMEAVLDTQFWLATHVTCITLGYTATLVAGGLGLIYVTRGFFTRSLDREEGKSLARMIYGTVCFGIFFSFVGTVLGGLWADDSWGRFWGWDPKENGALIIVLWNALILHARWDGLVKDRGLALLAIGGNIVTSWSWFGVNQLGAGLHSYGFTEGVLLALGFFCLSQLAMIGIGLVPLKYWRSNRYAGSLAV